VISIFKGGTAFMPYDAVGEPRKGKGPADARSTDPSIRSALGWLACSGGTELIDSGKRMSVSEKKPQCLGRGGTRARRPIKAIGGGKHHDRP